MYCSPLLAVLGFSIAASLQGGVDANWLFLHGIEAVTLGCGQRNIHTAEETLMIDDYLDACRVATWLVTEGAEEHESGGVR